MSEKEWINEYPEDYQKILGQIYMTRLEYKTIMEVLVHNNLFNLVEKLLRRKGSLYRNTDEYLLSIGRDYKGQPI